MLSRNFVVFVKFAMSVVVFMIFLQTVPLITAASNEISKTILYDIRAVVIAESTVVAKVADSDIKREKGLSNSEPIKDNEGMIFFFPKSEQHGIWMKEMNYPIDIIWVDQNYTVIHTETDVQPSTYPKVFDAPKPSKYVIEVPVGFIKKGGIRIGDMMSII